MTENQGKETIYYVSRFSPTRSTLEKTFYEKRKKQRKGIEPTLYIRIWYEI